MLKTCSTTYAGRPTDMITIPLTFRVRCTMTLAMCTRVFRCTPRVDFEQIKITSKDIKMSGGLLGQYFN